MHKRSARARAFALSTLATLAVPTVALAHHAMDGELPSTFWGGALSGLAHPVIGLDHLAMVLLVGAMCGVLRWGMAPAAAFVAASVVGCLLHVQRVSIPMAELVIASSVLAAGLFAWSRIVPSRGVATTVLGVLGAFHGYAYGESIVGAEPSPLLAYLFGFCAIQLALAATTMRLSLPRDQPRTARLALVRVLGTASVIVGCAQLL